MKMTFCTNCGAVQPHLNAGKLCKKCHGDRNNDTKSDNLLSINSNSASASVNCIQSEIQSSPMSQVLSSQATMPWNSSSTSYPLASVNNSFQQNNRAFSSTIPAVHSTAANSSAFANDSLNNDYWDKLNNVLEIEFIKKFTLLENKMLLKNKMGK